MKNLTTHVVHESSFNSNSNSPKVKYFDDDKNYCESIPPAQSVRHDLNNSISNHDPEYLFMDGGSFDYPENYNSWNILQNPFNESAFENNDYIEGSGALLLTNISEGLLARYVVSRESCQKNSLQQLNAYSGRNVSFFGYWRPENTQEINKYHRIKAYISWKTMDNYTTVAFSEYFTLHPDYMNSNLINGINTGWIVFYIEVLLPVNLFAVNFYIFFDILYATEYEDVSLNGVLDGMDVVDTFLHPEPYERVKQYFSYGIFTTTQSSLRSSLGFGYSLIHLLILGVIMIYIKKKK